MLCGALDRELTAEEQFAVLALTADPSLLACGCEEDSPACRCHLCVYQFYILNN